MPAVASTPAFTDVRVRRKKLESSPDACVYSLNRYAQTLGDLSWGEVLPPEQVSDLAVEILGHASAVETTAAPLNPSSLAMHLTVIFEPSDEGGYTAYVPALPGCISEGDTLDQARTNIREAIALYLEDTEDEEAPANATIEQITL